MGAATPSTAAIATLFAGIAVDHPTRLSLKDFTVC
jgi:hypothetical protein